MRRILSVFLLLVFSAGNVFAQLPTIYPGTAPVNIGATVGGFVVNLSGFASPNASIVLSSGGQFLRSTVADAQGYFYISKLSIKQGTTEFCFETVDFKRLGESDTCLTVDPITQSRDIKDIFLPPTIGLFKKQINAGEEALIYGFSMPGAKVGIKFQDGKTFYVIADAAGYYEYRFKKAPAGTYYLVATGELKGKPSLEPTKQAKLDVLSIPAQITTTTQKVGKNVSELLTTTLWGFLLILLLLLIIIIILILILKPAWTKAIFDKFKRKKLMHHDWLLSFLLENSSNF